jgi:hypothetical protein
MFTVVFVVGLDKRLVVVLFAGVIVGFVVNYGYFAVFEPPKTWHRVADFILANSNIDGLEVVYPQSNVYNGSGPIFEIKGDLWRIRWETVLYYGELRYALPSVFEVTAAFEENGWYSHVWASIQLLTPAEYDYDLSAKFFAGPQGNLTAYYGSSGDDTSILGYPTIMTGTGKFYISAVGATGCFEFWIDDYY